MTARYIVGDVRQVLATLEPESVDLVLTSPPFLALRSYLPADHPDKPLEIGSEPTPGEYVDTLLDVVEACTRVLAPHGSMCFELGDTYSGSGGAGGDYNALGMRANQPLFRQSRTGRFRQVGTREHRLERKWTGADGGDRLVPMNGGDGWPFDKSLCLIPELFRISLVYGFNPLTGRTTPRWRARNVVRWCRPNPPVGALGDKFRPATSEMVVICRDRKRYFDLDAVRRPLADSPGNRYVRKVSDRDAAVETSSATNNVITADYDPTASAGAPPLDWWKIPTQPYEGAHYATWPEELCIIPVKAMSPQKVCRECGKPSERIVKPSDEYEARPFAGRDFCADASNTDITGQTERNGWRGTAEYETLGWSDCGHNNWRNGLILDPFAGSGTTLQVATGHGRDAIGIDLDPRNAELAINRVGPLLLTVEHLAKDGAA